MCFTKSAHRLGWSTPGSSKVDRRQTCRKRSSPLSSSKRTAARRCESNTTSCRRLESGSSTGWVGKAASKNCQLSWQAEPTFPLLMNTKTIVQSVMLPAPPAAVFAALIDEKQHAAFTSNSAKIDSQARGDFHVLRRLHHRPHALRFEITGWHAEVSEAEFRLPTTRRGQRERHQRIISFRPAFRSPRLHDQLVGHHFDRGAFRRRSR